ncbi:hypothetical protein PHLGIDRAFT_119159 [Phlebiopsis gigantea 11061_1 CR5-6]|uniref:Uncharacterized protein n=1 Tax=Phlebiopsis gigantea (strain 11061_1 CR5-6) TaxID=745531 RepID=A0A0C3S9G9_PHLG1|nr:hypothetical protein PHLGIDRAFT_119159 [Phlebiopsis gigantea 11061_1 CR5-6]
MLAPPAPLFHRAISRGVYGWARQGAERRTLQESFSTDLEPQTTIAKPDSVFARQGCQWRSALVYRLTPSNIGSDVNLTKKGTADKEATKEKMHAGKHIAEKQAKSRV